MCIIIAKPAGVDIPSTEILNQCAISNRDGIGFAFNKTGDNPIISKGFKNVGKLEKILKTYGVTKDHNLMIHFRLATHGKCDQGNCHPFPLAQSFDDMRLLNFSCDIAISHNGIFGGMKKSEKYSDTMKFINNVLASSEIVENLDSVAVKELIRGYCGLSSKLAFLKKSGFSLVGDFELDEGVYYSNNGYKPWKSLNWKDGEYCDEHKKYDKCHANYRKEGKSWCYIHKDWDFCTWCFDHRKWDMCEHDKKHDNPPILIDSKGDTTLDLRKKCQWCQSTDNVRYDSNVQSDLCEECSEIGNTNDTPIRNSYYD